MKNKDWADGRQWGWLTVRRVDPQVDGQIGDAFVGSGDPIRLILDLFSAKCWKG